MIQTIRYAMLSVALLVITGAFAQTVTAVKPFDKIIVSPHIQVTFVEGGEESVTVESSTVDRSKIHIEVENKTLRVYLEGAKDIEKTEKDNRNGIHAIAKIAEQPKISCFFIFFVIRLKLINLLDISKVKSFFNIA